MTLIEAAKLARTAVSDFVSAELTVGQRYTNQGQQLLDTLFALDLAIAKAEQEELVRDSDCKENDGCPTEKAVLQRFWREAQREWQGLTDAEIDTWNIVGHESLREFVRAIETKLKEKNT